MFSVRTIEGAGNSVLSYLDIAISDQVPARSVANILQSATTAWNSELSTWRQGPMALRFWLLPSYATDDLQNAAELRKLKDELVVAIAAFVTELRGEQPFPPRPPQPLRVFRKRGKASFRFELDQPSREFLAHVRPNLLLPVGMNVTYETLEDFRRFTGTEIEIEAVQALTHLSIEQITALSSVIVIDDDSDTMLWCLP